VKLRFLYPILIFCLLLALPVMSGTVYSQSDAITESKVLAIVGSLDQAARKGSIAGLVGPLAKDIKIKMTVLSPPGAADQVFNFSKEQYAFNTRRTLRQRLGYQLERKNTIVKISNEGKTAKVTSDVYETLTLQKGTLRGVSSEVAILSLRDGKIVVTSLESRTRFY
jgi:hypothetical protein